MRRPDLGQHLWSNGLSDKEIVLIGVDFQSVAEAPGNTTDVSFFITYDDGERYCGTLNTRQGIQTVLRIVQSGCPVAIEGRLQKTTVVGQGGERYRIISGKVEPIGSDTQSVDAPTRQQRRAAERRAAKGAF